MVLLWLAWFLWSTHSFVASPTDYFLFPLAAPVLILMKLARLDTMMLGFVAKPVIWTVPILLYLSFAAVYFSPWYSMFKNEPRVTRRTSIFIAVTLSIYTALLHVLWS